MGTSGRPGSRRSADAVAGQFFFGVGDGEMDEFGDVALVDLGFDGAGFQAAGLEHVADEAVQALGGFANFREHFLLERGEIGLAQGGEVAGGALNGGQRRAHFVGHRVEESLAQPLGFGEQVGLVRRLDSSGGGPGPWRFAGKRRRAGCAGRAWEARRDGSAGQ